MFVFTARLDKRKILIAAAAVLVVVILIVALVSGSSGENVSQTVSVKSNDQRVEYLNSLGWMVEPEPLEEQTVVIPREFGDVYGKYNELQQTQGFDLSKYAGLEATRYTYRVLNHPSEDEVVADVIVYRNKVIAGDIQSTALDGFMTALEKAPS